MTVAVAHYPNAVAPAALREALQEAARRSGPLVVIHVTGSALDADRAEAYRAGVADDLHRAAVDVDVEVDWELRLVVDDDVAGAIVKLTTEVGAELVVIGSRRRTPVGKALLGSVTQSIVLRSDVPVLVVTAP